MQGVDVRRTLRLDRGVLDDCAKLEGKRLAFEVADFGWLLVIEPTATGTRVLNVAEDEPDVLVSAPSVRLARLALTMIASGAMAALSVKHVSRRWRGFGEFARKAPYFSSALIMLVGLYLVYEGGHALMSIKT